MKKRISAIVLSAVMCLSVGLTGCGKSDTSENPSSEVMLDFNPILSAFRVAVTNIDENSFEGKVFVLCQGITMVIGR